MAPAILTLAVATAVPIYEGRVFVPTAAADAKPVFTYERRVATAGDGLIASHLTRDAGGATIIEESALMTPAYALRRFDADNRQQGFCGTATVSADGRRIDFSLLRDGRWSHGSQTLNGPVVAGPSLHGFMLQHWNQLVAGDTVPVRMIVIARKTTYGFRIRLHSRNAERTVFSVTPTNWLLRLAVAPLAVAFDNITRQVLRYEGRVPPQLVEGGRKRDFDARVEYTMLAPAYR
jgi:hypothetical protein